MDRLASAYLTDGMLPRLRVLDRWRFLLARDRRLDDLRSLVGLDDEPARLRLDGDVAHLTYPGLPELPAAASDRLGRHLAAAVGPAELDVAGTRLDVVVPLDLDEGSRPVARIAVAHAPDGTSPPTRSYRRDPQAGLLAAPAELVGTQLRARLDLDPLRRGPGSEGVLTLRVQFDIGERTFGVPVPFGRVRPSLQLADRDGQDQRASLRVIPRADKESMTVLELARPRLLDKLRARRGRKK